MTAVVHPELESPIDDPLAAALGVVLFDVLGEHLEFDVWVLVPELLDAIRELHANRFEFGLQPLRPRRVEVPRFKVYRPKESRCCDLSVGEALFVSGDDGIGDAFDRDHAGEEEDIVEVEELWDQFLQRRCHLGVDGLRCSRLESLRGGRVCELPSVDRRRPLSEAVVSVALGSLILVAVFEVGLVGLQLPSVFDELDFDCIERVLQVVNR